MSVELAVGDSLPTLQFGPITREILANYAAASRDFNPIHLDQDFARSAGHPDVIAHGMLSFGLAARLISEWAYPNNVRQISGRFTAVTQLDDIIIVSGEVTAIEAVETGLDIMVAVSARVGDTKTVLAEAIVAIAAPTKSEAQSEAS